MHSCLMAISCREPKLRCLCSLQISIWRLSINYIWNKEQLTWWDVFTRQEESQHGKNTFRLVFLILGWGSCTANCVCHSNVKLPVRVRFDCAHAGMWSHLWRSSDTGCARARRWRRSGDGVVFHQLLLASSFSIKGSSGHLLTLVLSLNTECKPMSNRFHSFHHSYRQFSKRSLFKLICLPFENTGPVALNYRHASGAISWRHDDNLSHQARGANHTTALFSHVTAIIGLSEIHQSEKMSSD